MNFTTVLKKTLKYIGAACFWLLLWYLAAYVTGQELVLPSPASVLHSLISLAGEGSFWLSIAKSLVSVVCGFAGGALTGLVLAVLSSCSDIIDALISPAISAVKATPVASFIILALLWIGKTVVPAVIAALIVIPVVYAATVTAINGADPLLLEMADAYRFGVWKKLRLIYVPSVMTQFRSASRTGLGLAWKAGVAAEILCQTRNTVGSELYYSKIYLETPRMFAWTAVVVVLSVILEKLMSHLMKGGAER